MLMFQHKSSLSIRALLLFGLLLGCLHRPASAAQEAATIEEQKSALVLAEGELSAKQMALAKAKDDAELQAATEAAQTAADEAVAAIQASIDSLKAAGRSEEASQLAAFLTTTTGVIDTSNLDVGMLKSLLETWTAKGKDWVVDELPGKVVNLLILLVFFVVFKLAGTILGRLTRKTLGSAKLNVSQLLRDFAVTIVSKGTLLIGLVIGLQTVGIPMGPVLAGIGVLGFVVGFALQDTMSNFASGVMLLLYRPFDVGNFITAAGVSGTVHSLSLVSTKMTTPDNQTVIVPNSSIWGGVITNVTAQRTRRVDLVASIGYQDDIAKAEQALAEVVGAHPLVLKEPAPAIMLFELGDSSVNFVVRPWCKTSDYWGVKCDLTKAIKLRFDADGISIPFPQRDVHLHGEKT